MTKKGPKMDFLENPVYPKKSAPKKLHFNTYSHLIRLQVWDPESDFKILGIEVKEYFMI